MDCSRARDILGIYIDGELEAARVEELNAHIRACQSCAAELNRLTALLQRLQSAAGPAAVSAPADVWPRIEQRLDARLSHAPMQHVHSHSRHRHRRHSRTHRSSWLVRFLRRPVTAAASLALLIGVSTSVIVWLNPAAQSAQAASVDYAVLLDELQHDADAAVNRFLKHYDAMPIAPQSDAAAAYTLNFRIPPELPGGFRRETVYRVRFGAADGVVARYRRGSEPLVVFFHPPVPHTPTGIHRESRCHVAGREGHRVEVGPWQLIHFTDDTTCHCLLSKLTTEAAQAAIFQEIAPSFDRPDTGVGP